MSDSNRKQSTSKGGESKEQENNELLQSSGIKDYDKKIKTKFRNNLKSKVTSAESEATQYTSSYDTAAHSTVSEFVVGQEAQLDIDIGVKDLVYFERHKNFSELCDEQLYDTQSKICYVCNDKMNSLFGSQKKYCKFCGNAVCVNCSKRKRPNPKNQTDFVRICENCHFDYIFLDIQTIYLQKKKQRDLRYAREDQKYEKIKQHYTKMQNIKFSNEQRYNNASLDQQHQIKISKQQRDKLDQKNKEINQENEDLHNQTKEIELQRQQIEKETIQGKDDYYNLMKQFEGQEKDIKDMDQQIDIIKKQLNQADQDLTRLKHTSMTQSLKQSIKQKNNNNSQLQSNEASQQKQQQSVMFYSKLSESGIESQIDVKEGRNDSYYRNSLLSESIVKRENKNKNKKLQPEGACGCGVFRFSKN